MGKKKLITQVIEGRVITEGDGCPECECDTMVDVEGTGLVCSGCGQTLEDCNLDNGHNCDECDPEYCPECGDYCREEYCQNADCEECEHGEND